MWTPEILKRGFNSMHCRSALTAMTAIRAIVAATCIGSMSSPAWALGTAAGTQITNTATATFSIPGGGTSSVNSNTVTTLVDELIDVNVAWADPGDVTVQAGSTNQVLTYTVTNTGNAGETYQLSTQLGSGANFDPTATSIVIDSNGNGVYDPGIDQVYTPGSNDPSIAADGSIAVFVLSTIPPSAADQDRGRIDLVATSTTATGAPGTAVAGAGAGGVSAVIGSSGGLASDDGYYRVSSVGVTLTKSATITDPFGGSASVPGSTITYTLVASVSGSGDVSGLVVTDPIPTGTAYKNGSITLGGSPLTDAADADAGRFDGTGISVELGTVPAGQVRTVSFQVKVNSN
jgi:uncharacterized repeat protein (TIGR01451 family)